MMIASSRRALLTTLVRAAGALGAVLAVAPPARAGRPVACRVFLQATHVAGTAYYGADRVRRRLKRGDALVLRREPANPYDGMAIEVFTAAGAKLGYVPRAVNRPLARLMDAGFRLEAKVLSVRPWRYDDIRMGLSFWASRP